jgi:PKD domain-containing protein
MALDVLALLGLVGNSLPDIDRIWADTSLYPLITTALATNRNWKRAKTIVRPYKKRHTNTGSLLGLRSLLPRRKLLVFAVVLGLALSPGLTIIHPAYAPTMSINVQNFAFNPQNVTIQTGDSVTWANNDPVIYTLWFTNALNGSTYLFSQPINPGTTWTHAFPDKLRLSYYDFDRLYITGQLIIVTTLRGEFFSTLSSGNSVIFAATVTGGTAPYKLFWTFGDGTNSTGANPTHTYQTIASYSVTLTVTDSSAPGAFAVTVTHLVTLSPGGGGGRRLVW